MLPRAAHASMLRVAFAAIVATTIVSAFVNADILPSRASIESARPQPTTLASLSPDVQVNVKVPNCFCSGGRPTNQFSPSVAAWGRYVLASWYDLRYRCLGSGLFPAQSYGYSTDYGATFKDAGLLYGPAGSVFFGDPAVTVNSKTGDFYITGYRRITGQSPTGLMGLKGHFVADSFVIDINKTIAPGGPGESYERPWIVADSVSGRVHVVWQATDNTTSGTEIEIQTYDANLNPIGSETVLASEPTSGASVQNPYDVVGPHGELYVAWTRYRDPFVGPLETHELVRCDDFGATYGPMHVVSTLNANTKTDAPGSTRLYGLSDVSMAVDMSMGPHRGRAYMVWDESVHFRDAPFGSYTSVVEVENNGAFATATPFVVGGKLRGTVGTADVDFYRFTATHGQVLVMKADTVTSAGFIRVICETSSDTSSVATYHTLGYADGLGAVVGLPYDGTYYVVIDATDSPPGSYTYLTALYTPTAADYARDQRDQVVSYSDDGVSWSAPVRMNDSPPGYDGCFPSVTVDDRGRVHAFWMDYRSDPGCGDLSNAYMASSGDGGVTWGENRRLSDASSYWSFPATCNFYIHGAYEQIAASGDHLYAIFPDARLGDTDLFMDASLHRLTSSCPPPSTAPAGSSASVPFSLANESSFATPLAWQLVDTRGWLTGATPGLSGTQTLAAQGGSIVLTATLALPPGCTGDSTTVRLITHDPFVPGAYDTCTTVVRCGSNTGITTGFYSLAFASPRPNPSTGRTQMGYTLSRTGPVRLEVFDAAGARIRTLDSGIRGAGPHDVTWDGRDEAGRLVAPAAYFARLDAEGQTMRHVVMVLR
jgi:hypothetical protein